MTTRASAASPSRGACSAARPGPASSGMPKRSMWMCSGATPAAEQRRLGLVVDAVRAADEGVVDAAGVDQRRQELADLVAAEPAAVERQVGRLLREHHVQRQAREVAVLQVLELFHEHGRALLAVAVDQREARLRLGGEHRLHDRQDRRDAAAAGDAEVVARRARDRAARRSAPRASSPRACRRPSASR